MTKIDIDALMRGYAARVTVAADRDQQVIAAVLAHLPRQGAASPSSLAWWLAWLGPVSRLAVPMAAAAGLGVIVGHGLDAAQAPIRLAEMLSVSSFYLTGL